MKRRVFTLILALVLVLSAGVIGVSAAELKSGSCGTNVSYSLTDSGILTISGTGAIQDYTYSKAAPWYVYRGKITTVIINEGVTSIGQYAFRELSVLSSVSMPKSLTSIGKNAFYLCKGLTHVTLPEGLTELGEGAFNFCSSLSSVSFPKSLKVIGEKAFSDTALSVLNLPEGITTIGDRAFYDCDMTQLTLPSTVTSIGEYAFAFNDLVTVRIPDGVTNLPDGCFHYNSKMEAIEIPASVTSIHSKAFDYCKKLSVVYYYGTEEQWNALSSGVSYLKNASVAFVPAGKCSHIDQSYLEGQEPTCSEEGLEAGWVCKLCGEDFGGQEVIPALGHKWSAWEIITEPTATATGEKVRQCDTCGDEESVTLPKVTNPFTDVQKGTFYYDPVLWAFSHEVTTGVTATTFQPGSTCTRGQVVTFLWRAAGSPEPTTTENPFSDVEAGRFYYKAVLWAAENGITTGTTETTFAPNNTVTRAQFVTFLWRAAGKPEYEAFAPFSDLNSKSFYYDAVIWATSDGYCTGVGNGKFSPDGECTRGQTVTFLYRYYANAPVTAPSAIGLSRTHMYLTDFSYYDSLSYSVMPEAASNEEVTFSSSDTSVFYIDGDGNLIPVAPGTAQLIAKCGNAVAYCTVEVPNLDKGWFAFRIHNYVNDNFILNVQTNPRVNTYESSEGHLVVFATMYIEVLTNGGFWKTEFYSVAYDQTTGQDIHQPVAHYEEMADRYFGANALHYMDLAIEYNQLELQYYNMTEYYEKAPGWWVAKN